MKMRQPAFTQWLILASALLTLGGATLFDLVQERNRTQSREEERLLAQVRVIQKNVGVNLRSIQQVLRKLREDLRRPQAGSPLDEHLKTLVDAMPGVRTLTLLDAEGTIYAASRPELLGQNFKHRDYFKTAQQHPDTDTLYISPPFRTVLGVFAINVVQVVPGSQGEFAGIVAATLNPQYFIPLLDSVRYAPDMWTSIVHEDGSLFLMEPTRAGVAGMNLARPDTFFTRHRDSGRDENVFSGTVYATGERKMIAQGTIRLANVKTNATLIAAAARDLDEIYAPWQRDLLVKGGLFALIALLSILGLYVSQRRQREYQRHAAESAEALRLSTETLRASVEAAAIGMALVDLEGRFMRANGALCRILGYREDELLQKTFREITHPDDHQASLALVTELLTGSRDNYRMEKRYFHRDGHTVWTQVSASTVRDQSGQVLYFIAQIQDISESKQTRQALADSERFMKTLIDILPGMVSYWTDELRCGFANIAYLEWFGKTPAQMRGIRIEELLGDELFHNNEPYIRAALNGETQRYQRALTKADGSIGYTWAHYIPDRDGERVRGFFVLVADITELKEAQVQLEHLNEQLQQRTAEAEAASHAKSAFLANMSHEIRTPMNAILGLTQLVLETDLQPQQQDFLGKVHRSAQALLRILNDILDFSKIEAGRLEIEYMPMRVEEILANVADLFGARLAEKALQFSIAIDAAVPAVVMGDALRFTQVLDNLVGNAVKFTARGEIHVAAEVAQHGENALTLRFAVRDNGIGLSPRQIEGLFQPFAQADSSTTRQYGGTGLGLVISRTLVEMMGGKIGVSSTDGQGATFFFTLQVGVATAADALESHAPPPSTALHSLAGLHILLVEDNALNQEMAAVLLQRRGVRVTLANHGSEAVERVGNESFDAILMDLHMPVMDGIAATRLIKTLPNGKGVPIIALTAAVLADDRERCSAAGMSDFLAKPIDPDSLAEVVAKWTKPGQPAPTAPATAPAEAAPKPDNGQLTRLFAALIPYLEEQELAPEELTHELRRFGLSAPPSEPLARLVKQVDHFDHQGALLTIAQIAAELGLELPN
ncbi:MAG: PAS domain S-box protein [Sulfuricella sp.]|nr:PAS domain S-box protein [Sulfuricella sp.]